MNEEGKPVKDEWGRGQFTHEVKLDDEGKYFLDHMVEEYGKEEFLIGVSLKKPSNEINVVIAKLIEKRNARLSHFACGRHYYISSVNVLEETHKTR